MAKIALLIKMENEKINNVRVSFKMVRRKTLQEWRMACNSGAQKMRERYPRVGFKGNCQKKKAIAGVHDI